MDFVPVHFALDSYGLAQYDGTALYEYPHSAVGVSEWGSCNFMHSRGEVRRLPAVFCKLLDKRNFIYDGASYGCHQQGYLLAGGSCAGRKPQRSGIPPVHEQRTERNAPLCDSGCRRFHSLSEVQTRFPRAVWALTIMGYWDG